MVNRCPDEREAEGDTDRSVEVEGFCGNMALIVKEGNNCVIYPNSPVVEDRIRRDWTFNENTCFPGPSNGGFNLIDFFPAKKP